MHTVRRVATSPWDARKNGFWDSGSPGGSYARFRNRQEYLRRRYGVKMKPKSQRPKWTNSYEYQKAHDLIPEYHEGVSYSKRELELMADDIIYTDPEKNLVRDGILNPDRLRRQKRHEIYTELKAQARAEEKLGFYVSR